jgi:hypothetical protein
VQGSLDVGVTHQLHQRGQADAGKHHIRIEDVPEAVVADQLDAGGAAMLAEQRA